MGLRNVTIFASNSSSIVYNPSSCDGSGWAVDTKKGGSCFRSCTLSAGKTPSAKLSFTGSAVYYISTYFNNQSIDLSLDGACKMNVQLTPPMGISANSSVRQVFFHAVGLKEVEHTLEIYPADNGSTLSVDTIVFTTNQTVASPLSSKSPLSPSASKPIPIPTFTSDPSAIGASSESGTRIFVSTQTAGIIIGSIAGTISSLILIGLLIMMCSRRRDLNALRYYRFEDPYSSHFSVQQQTQATAESYKDAFSSKSPEPVRPFPSKSPEPVRPLRVPLRGGPSASRQVSPSLHSHHNVELAENQWYLKALDRMNQTPVSPRASPTVEITKLQPLRKASVRP